MRLERQGADGLTVVLDDGARSIVTGANIRTYEDAARDWSGDRAYWTEASLHVDGDDFVVHVVDVTDHEGGTDRRTGGFFRSADRGRTWTREQDGSWPPAASALARLSTHWHGLESIGDHRLIRSIGGGSLGALHEAFAPNQDRVAFRVLDGSNDDAVRARIQALAERLPHVRHPNLVAVRAIANTPDGRLFVVTDFVREGTLERALSDGPAFSPKRAAGLARDMLAGLEALHAAGIVHGDVRPANVFFVKARTVPLPVALSDAGLLEALDDPRTTRCAVRTERAYLPPEVHRTASRPDVLADVYAVGTCLYEMLAGKRPFTATSPIEVAYDIMTKTAPPLTSTPEALAAVVKRAMAKDPAARFQTAAALRAALEQVDATPSCPGGPSASS